MRSTIRPFTTRHPIFALPRLLSVLVVLALMVGISGLCAKPTGATAVLAITRLYSFSPGSLLLEPAELNRTLFFQADDSVHGYELWKSDGTTAGTTLVKDINQGNANSDPTGMSNINGLLLFWADDGVHGYELWKSDGTDAGTSLVADINPGSAGSSLSYITNVHGTLYIRADNGVHGLELWKSDGTSAGTSLVADINPGSAASNPFILTDVNGTLFFQATDDTGNVQLWALPSNIVVYLPFTLR